MLITLRGERVNSFYLKLDKTFQEFMKKSLVIF